MEQELNYTNIFLFIIIILLAIVGSIGLAIKDMKHSDEDYLIENKCEKDFEEYSDYMDINLSNEQISCYCSPSCTLSELPHPNFSLEK